MTDVNEERRFTDKEVAVVLKRAAELEEKRQADLPGKGLTLSQLHDIAREVGLSPDMVNSAIADMRRNTRVDVRSLLGAAPMNKVVRAVPAALDRDGMQRLVHLIEDRLSATGTVTEALGAVRWTSTADGHHFNSTTQVALTPSGRDTQIQVAQRLSPRLQRVLHILPGAWSAMIAGAIVASAGVGTGPALAILAGSVGVGVAIGRGIWNHLAKRSSARVERLAAELTHEAGKNASNVSFGDSQ